MENGINTPVDNTHNTHNSAQVGSAPANPPTNTVNEEATASSAASSTAPSTAPSETAPASAMPGTASVPAGKLTQIDDEPRENIHDALSPATIKEITRTGGNWMDHFDPQVGLKAHPSEKATYVVPVKFFQLIPDMEGPAKSKTQKVVNGVPQYKPRSVLKDMPVRLDEEYVQKALGETVKDTLSGYVLNSLMKEKFNRLEDSEYYGRKVPVYPLNSAFPVSLQGIEAISGISYQKYLEDTHRKGWYRQSAKMQQFEYNVFCESKENIRDILAQKGGMMTKWKASDFPTLAIAGATFKRIGSIVEQGFEYKGRKPQSSLLFAMLDAVKIFMKQYEDTAQKIESTEENIKAGLVPGHDELPENLRHTLDQCNTQSEHWVAVVCGIKAHAEQLRDDEEKKLAKVNEKMEKELAATGDIDSLLTIPELDFPELSADTAL